MKPEALAAELASLHLADETDWYHFCGVCSDNRDLIVSALRALSTPAPITPDAEIATQTYQSAADCPLGEAHGLASIHGGPNGEDLCDFCGFAVEATRAPDAEIERVYGALRWIYVHGMRPDHDRPQVISDVLNEAFASYRIAQSGMPDPRSRTPSDPINAEGEGTYAGIPLNELARSNYHPGDDA